MSWTSWDSRFAAATLKNNGDGIEIHAVQLGLIAAFPNYEIFWRNHIAPATNRPVDITLRSTTSRIISAIAMVSHSLLVDLVNSAESLEKIKRRETDPTFRNCTDAIKADGDAIQKFTDLQKLIENDLANALGTSLPVWSPNDWITRWKPSREKIISYRNFLTHMGRPQIMMILQADGSHVPFVLHQDYVVNGQFLTWPEQQKIHQTAPHKWSPLADVCDELHRDTVRWLNDVYAEVVGVLKPLQTNLGYQQLWGWDTSKSGAAAWQAPAPAAISGAIGHQSSSATIQATATFSGSNTTFPPSISGQA